MAGTAHEDPRVIDFLGASLSDQTAMLAQWGLPRSGLLLMMNACENRCFFCANEGVMDPPASMITRWSRVVTWLDANRSSGVERLCVAGTEPALHQDFYRALERAGEVGFQAIEVMTSGLQLAPPGAAERWAALRVRTVAVPLYGSSAAVHDSVVGREAFERTVAGLDAAHRAGIEVRVHTLALTRTLDHLGALARFVRERYGTRLSLAPVRPKEALFDYATEAPDLDALGRAVAAAGDLALVGFPACLAPDTPRGAALVIRLYFRGQVTGYATACEGCPARQSCPGIVLAELPRAVVYPTRVTDGARSS